MGREVEERAFWLAWSRIAGIGPVLLRRLQQHFETLAAAWEAGRDKLAAVEGFGPQIIETVVKARSRIHPQQLLQQHEQENPHFWTPADSEDYPRLLLETSSPPAILYYQGIVQTLENQGIKPLIGIVGTRNPSEYGRRWTRKITTALVQRGFVIVSGLADGIDTEAHRSCLETGGRTLAVLGTGVDVVYPARNRELYKEILHQGLVLSEYPAGTSPDRTHFPCRNRIIAGLSRAVVVMEAPTRSGALITARFANDYGRDVYVLPGSLDNPRSLGCLEFISKGAQVILSENHLLEMLGEMPQLDSVVPSQSVEQLTQKNLEPELEQVLKAIALESMPLDLIVQQTGMSTGTVSSALLQLELMDLVVQLPGMRYQRC